MAEAQSSSIAGKAVVYRGFPVSDTYVWSPFVTKLEFRLRLADIPYTVGAGSPMTGPKGKIPYVNIGPLLGTGDDFVGDSNLIPKHLQKIGRMQSLNDDLTPPQRLSDRAIINMIEDKLYYLNVREKWMDNFYTQREGTMWALSYPLRIYAGMLAWRKITNFLLVLGVTRFTKEEVTTFKTDIWKSLAEALETSRTTSPKGEPFWILGGTKPTEADTCVFGMIASVFVCASNPESLAIVKGLPVLEDYATRIHSKYFSDYRKWS